jgi:hypothetical protein
MNDLPPCNKVTDTETSAMDAWIKKLESDQPVPTITYGTPVQDPSSQTSGSDYQSSFDVLKRNIK